MFSDSVLLETITSLMGSTLFSFWWFDIALAHIILTVGFFIATLLLTRTVHEKKLSLAFLSDHIALFSLSMLFMGRVGETLFIYPAISEKMFMASNFTDKALIFAESFFSFWHGGINIAWAIGSFLIVFMILCTMKNEHPLAWMDAFSLPLVVFLIIFSIAAFFAGWNYGSPVSDNYLLAISYPNNNEIQYSGSIHPVQLYSTFLFFILFIFSSQVWNKKIREEWPNGIFGGILISSLFFILFFLEFFSGDTSYMVLEIIPINSIIFFGIGISIIIFMIIRGHFHVISQFKKIISQ